MASSMERKCSLLHRNAHPTFKSGLLRLTEEAVAIRHKVIHLPKTPEDLEVVSRGFAGPTRLKASGCVTIGAASFTPMWAGPEFAFGMMKTRFRANFLQVLEVHHTFVPHVVTACALLCNICPCADTLRPQRKMWR
ncbi:hypothetical protein OJAV_G00154300 [Oryzias javanicus]|uniref:Uncharacterized protein n=1 Tax=Oryzias javanicus TaxID=123683 RepID=A0A3S2PB69_ORYJA|nr:hypothetical protein OJAV_G00154300 [Oryzias javanicus]